MKLVSFLHNSTEKAGLFIHGKIYPLNQLSEKLPTTMNQLLEGWESYYPLLQRLNDSIENKASESQSVALDEIQLLAPVPHPSSCRDGYAFRQHVATARRNRNAPMIPAFDEYPVFYFTNHKSIVGPGEVACMPDHFHQLDFELEAAIVICKKGRNIKAEDADEYIGGLLIMNDLSARLLQMEEMLLNLGPAKGKDFATAIGPWLVTLDELKAFEVAAPTNHTGKSWNLTMKCFVNGQQVSEGNLADMNWTFAEIIERASYGVDLYPGDVIGSGTVGTGCFLELNGTGKLNNPHYVTQWLQAGDKVELEIDGLGKLSNTIIAENSIFSILDKKLKA